MKQQIKIFLLEVVAITWFLIKGFFLLVSKGVLYLYTHRNQIAQHKLTLPTLIVLSVVWTGFSSFKKVTDIQPVSVAVQTEMDTDENVPTAVTVDQQLTEQEYAADDSNAEEPFQDTKLVAHIMDWVGTPHRDNTQSKNGTDCSGFVQAVFQDAHGIELSRSSTAMYEKDVYKIHKTDLQEGDLVFFNTFGKGISHVGIYLKDGKFAHTSSSKGVTVSSLHDKYYKKNYRGAGRVKDFVN
jgi:lipoprotein Spr/probable lipoprotein NlpC